MGRSGIIHRLQQKWNYYAASNPFERKVAELNRNESLVILNGGSFRIKECDLTFDSAHHNFVLERFQLFETLNRHGKFRLLNLDLLFEIDGITVRITTAEEMFIVHEIFFEHCYSILVSGEYSVVDVGMNVGYAALLFARQPRVKAVYAFEPFRQTREDAVVNFSLNPELGRKVQIFEYGLGRTNEHRLAQFSQHLKGKNSILKPGGNESIELKNAAEAFGTILGKEREGRFFVKMDCEGAEYDIFESFAGRIPDQIFGFIIEYHSGNPQAITDVLLQNRFKIQCRGTNDIGLITAFR